MLYESHMSPAGLALAMVRSCLKGFAPHRIGGAPLVLMPKWVKHFRRLAPMFSYIEEYVRGHGHIFFPLATGMVIFEATKGWSRAGRGGEWAFNEEAELLRFTPDKKPYVESSIVTPWGTTADKAKKLILPRNPNLEREGRELARVWGAN
jgi:hypothetical protein